MKRNVFMGARLVAVATALALGLCGCGRGPINLGLFDDSGQAQQAQDSTEEPTTIDVVTDESVPDDSSPADYDAENVNYPEEEYVSPVETDPEPEPQTETETVSGHAQYYEGDQAVLTGTLHYEEYEYKGTWGGTYILVLDTPIDCYVTSYVDYNNGGNPRWHENVTNVCIWSNEEDMYDFVGGHVSVNGTIQGGGKFSAYYDENGEFQNGGGDVMVSQFQISAA